MSKCSVAFCLCCFLLTLSLQGFSLSEPDKLNGCEILEYRTILVPVSDTTIVFEITAEAHGFMCPFLTPIYMSRLKSEGAIEVSKSPDLAITAVFPITTAVTEELLRNWAAMVGYEKDKVHARKK